MSLLEETRTPVRTDEPVDDTTIDLTEDRADERAPATDDDPKETPEPLRASPLEDGRADALIDPTGRTPSRGMRIRHVRLGSLAKLSLVFFALAFGVIVGTLVALWNVAQTFGFIAELEDTVVTALGLEAFAINGGALFRLVVIGTAVFTSLGWVLTLLLGAVYNAACAVLGGLAVETGPLKRRRRVFSLRHRGFVTIRA